jgi:hypothetical protein
MIIFVLHKDHISKLETMNEILNTRTEVSSSCPNIFNESDFLWINFELLSQPSIVKLYAFIFEEDILIRFVEDLNANHNKARVMSTCEPDIIQVVESETELRADQRICWWIHFSCNSIRLEAKDSSCNIINIIFPTCNYRVAINFCTRNSSSCQ